MLLVAGAPGGRVLTPFAGSGSEMVAAVEAGMHATGFELNPDYAEIASRRLAAAAPSGA
jgi:DNA modification methylase